MGEDIRRAIKAKRISNMRDETSESIEDQETKLNLRRDQEGDVEFIGEAVDENVSGDVDMINRPQLGFWLKEENRGKWDELWVTTQDRLSRDDIHFMAFVFKMLEWGKTVIVLDDPSFNEQMHTPEGRLILHAKALGPAKELARIKARVQDSHDRRLYTDRWPGGIPSFGYVPVQRYENGKVATYIELDEAMLSTLHQMRKRMIAGESYRGLALWLTMSEIFTARDRARLRRGKQTRARKGRVRSLDFAKDRETWSASGVKRLLTNEALLGYKKHNRKVLIDKDGNPIKIAEAAFNPYEWETLQAACDARELPDAPRVNHTAPLGDLVFCHSCKSPFYHRVVEKKITYRYYRCDNRPLCKEPAIRAEIVEETVEILFLQKYGSTRVTKRVWVTGSDKSAEIGEVKQRIARLRRQDEDGDWDSDREQYRERMGTLKGRLAKLQEVPVLMSGWNEQDQGMTYLELWPHLDMEEKRLRLLDAGFRMIVGDGTCWPEKAAEPAIAA